MHDLERNAFNMERTRRKNERRNKKAFEHVLCSEEGRVFLSFLMNIGKLYDAIDTPEEEGARRMLLILRDKAAEYGLMDKWRQSEKEADAFEAELQMMMREEEGDEGEYAL